MRFLSYAIVAFWVLALARTLVNLAMTPRLAARSPRRCPRVSVVIPARDEERDIERAVRAFLAQTWPELEIVVVNDRSADATGAILASIRQELVREVTDDARPASSLIVVDNEEPPSGWLGKPWALHQGSLRATGKLLLFVDADVIYEPDAVTSLVAHLEESDAAMLSVFPRLEMRGFWENVVMPNLAVFAFSFLPLWLTNRTRIALLAIGGGTGNLVRRADYDAAGGHQSLRDAVVDDVALARLLRRSGCRTETVRGEGKVTVRMYHGLGEIVRGFTKNAFAVFGYSYAGAASFLALTLVFHLLPFVFALMGSGWALGTVGLIVVTRVLLFSSIGYRLDSAVFAHPLMIGAWGWILVRSMWVTGIRRRIHWRGRTYDAGDTRFGAD